MITEPRRFTWRDDDIIILDEPPATGGDDASPPGAGGARAGKSRGDDSAPAVRSTDPSLPDPNDCNGAATKFNPYHDNRGRFASGGAAGGIASDPKALAQRLIAQARAEEPAVTEALHGAAQAAGGHMEGLDFRIKSEGSLARKIEQEHRVNRQQTMEQVAGSVTDVLRYTMVLPTERYSRGVDTALQHLKTQGMEPHDHKFRNYWGGTEYQGLNTVMKTKSGQRFELQFHTAQSLATKEGNHPLYEQQRVSRSARLRQVLADQMTRAWANVQVPDGVQALAGTAYGWGG